MNVNASTDSSDGGLRVKLVEHDRRTGNGQIQIIELRQERARYYVTVLYGSGQQGIDYKTYDFMKATVFAFQARPNDDVTDITIVAVPAD
jgi:NADPH-dependent 2,4-dienoyl-CoA reductase/sulfur reductase-like enzyme